MGELGSLSIDSAARGPTPRRIHISPGPDDVVNTPWIWMRERGPHETTSDDKNDRWALNFSI